MEILAGDDIGGGLRPSLRDFDIFLAEDGRALFIADERGTLFPFDYVERRLFAIGKIAGKGQTFPRACGSFLHGRIRYWGICAQSVLHGCHCPSRRLGSRQRAGGPHYFTPLPGAAPRLVAVACLLQAGLASESGAEANAT